MITESSEHNISNNEYTVNASMVSVCDRLENDTASDSPKPSSEESTTDGRMSSVLDSNYIEMKIKSILNEENEKCEANSSKTVNGCDRACEQTHISGIFTAEDSCNAVDNKISTAPGSTENELAPEELSFNGKIADMSLKTNILSELTATTREDIRREALHRSFELLTKNNNLMHYNSEKSPDLFDDDERHEENFVGVDSQSVYNNVSEKTNFTSGLPGGRMDRVDQIEENILERLQMSLSGILPPPSVTYSYIDVNRMIALYNQNKSSWYDSDSKEVEPSQSLCNKPTHTMDQLATVEWPDLLKLRAHGVCYNRSKVTEKIELLGLKYIDRYIGSETGSTFNIPHSPSSTKKRNLRTRLLTQSPGSRLSHLARRRAVFSSANLLNSSHGSREKPPSTLSQSITSRVPNRQILLDPKKSNNRRKNKGRTPKRRTPSRRKTPRRKTPGSSVKKRSLSLAGTQPPQTSINRESSKRALFQSPPNEQKANHRPSSAASCVAANSRVQKSKRALFSPPKRISQDSRAQSNLLGVASVFGKKYNPVNDIGESSGVTVQSRNDLVKLEDTSCKRKRNVDVDADENPLGKKPRIEDVINEQDLTPRSLKLARSQSFCVGSQNSNTRRVSETSLCGKSLFRANSDVMFPNSVSRPVTVLTENHKKKLLWAVSQALQKKQITVKHENFKQYASNLARVVKRLFLEFNDQAIASTSEKLLRLANKHAFEVIQGRNVDDIYSREKTRILNARNSVKPQGYIAPDDFEHNRLLIKRSVSTTALLSENSMDSSFGTSATQQLLLSQSSIFSQSSEGLNQLSQISTNGSDSAHNNQPPVVVERAVLRENIDSEQRQKSAHKQVSFSGRDQKNLSPYADNKASLQVKAKLLVGGAISTSILKAKRQISFE